MAEIRALNEWSDRGGAQVRDVQKICCKCGHDQFHVKEEQLKFQDGRESFGSTWVLCVRCGYENMDWS